MAGGGEREREMGPDPMYEFFLLIKNDIREKTIMPLTK
jgi:hypothetical protein